MKLYSEVLSNVLKILLWALVALVSISLLCTVVLAIDVNLYVDYAYSLDGFVGICASVLYFIVLVIYLIWIYRVHVDLRDLFPFYSRTPGMSLACMMIPFFNFYGIPSTYYRMGQYMQRLPATLKQGRFISGLAAPLIILFFVTSGLTRVITRMEDPSATLYLVSSIFDVALYSVFLSLCILVSRGLKNASLSRQSAAAELDAPELSAPESETPKSDAPDWVSNNLAKGSEPTVKG
ncbi:hypothetical protein [Cohnella cholangitidis]|uniref:DUF4328 domain-containing protein n=1 Tax=Cohnella cholangitidis TaxID=2598458 RepID=A0A7G5BZV5_9BACL|nr:hypothetical protein [Cohnella cholangitidis]QMV42489.1 hypothetical protein FPL14_15760 [Cohnella cholangitidis]